jgi:copper transport protein
VRRSEVTFASPIAQFSRLAGWMLGVILVTGISNALLNITAADQLITTTWGRLVLVKVSLLAGLAWLGNRQRSRVLPQLADAESSVPMSRFRAVALAEVGLMVVAFGTATAMASGIPAEAEAASRVQTVATAFADGQLNITVDPAQTGINIMHVYFLAATGQLRDDVADPAISLIPSSGQPIEAQLLPSGPGHWTALSVPLNQPGRYTVRVTANVDGEPTTVTGGIVVR